MTDLDFWAQRLNDHLADTQQHTTQAHAHAQQGHVWDVIRDTAAAVAAATLAHETARQWRQAHQSGES